MRVVEVFFRREVLDLREAGGKTKDKGQKTKKRSMLNIQFSTLNA